MVMRLILVITLLLSITISSSGQNGNALFDESYVHDIKVESDDPDFWKSLLSNYNLSVLESHTYDPVKITLDGILLNTVGIRIKGYTSALDGFGKKKPFRIDFDEFLPGQNFDGIKKLSLNNAFLDPTYMRDVLALNIMRTAGVIASRTAYAKLYINGVYWGLYIMVEQIDKTFLTNHFRHDSGNLFKCQASSDLSYHGSDLSIYKGWFELKTNETADYWFGLVRFIRYANKDGMSDQTYREGFPKIFDIPTYLNVLAIDIILLNWDSYYDNGRNFYLYEDIKTGQFHWIPWDYNFSFSDLATDILAEHTVFQNKSKPLIRNLLSDPLFKAQLLTAYRSILDDNFTLQRLTDLIARNKSLIYNALEADRNKSMSMEMFEKSLEQDATANVKDTTTSVFNIKEVFITATGNTIPDSVLHSGIFILDTATYDVIKFDTVEVNLKKEVYINCIKYWDYQTSIIGLKSFIQKRIDQVNHEIDSIGIVLDVPDEVHSNSMSISPNPTKKFIDVSGRITQGPFSVYIYDLTGRTVLREENKKHLEIDHLSPGMYIIQMNNDNVSLRKCFIKSAD
jgi:hypothetical protein